MEIFQERLLALRKQANLKQDELARELQISYRSYRRYEAGQTEPTLSALVRMAEYFQVSIDYLAGRET